MINITRLIFVVYSFFFITVSFAQENDRPSQGKLTHHMTPEEELRRHEIGKDFYPTLPPSWPVRQVAEFEHMQSILIRYPFGIPISLIAEMAEDCNVLTIVLNQSQENTVISMYQAAGVNLDHCEFLHAPTDTHWTRDYGPWFVVDGNNEVGICNFPYNRPRPDDDDIPIMVAEYLDIELYGMNLIHTGGNYMCDGMGIAASTILVWEENPTLSHIQINNLVHNYLGIETYHVLPDPLGEYIKHIDCWGKFLDVDKVLIGEVPVSDPRYDDFEYVADYFAEQISSYSVPYQVFRVYTPGNYHYTPYTNSLILNKKVFVPITGSPHDNAALDVYEEAMPGYEIFGIMSGSWANTDALHCRTKGIADLGMLYIRHIPLLGDIHQADEFEITAEIIPYSQEPLYSDSLLIYYSVDGGIYYSVPLFFIEDHTYSGSIPGQPEGSEMAYYLHAADESGRSMDHPYIGPPDPHVFNVIYPLPDVTVWPDTLIYDEPQQAILGQDVIIRNESDSNVYINYINPEGDDQFYWLIDPWTITLPYLMYPGDSLILTVVVGLPVESIEGYLEDTLFVETDVQTHNVFLLVDSLLISSINDQAFSRRVRDFTVYPNPFNTSTNICFSLEQTDRVLIEVYNLNGQKIFTLLDKQMIAGKHLITWDGVNEQNLVLPNGVYFIRLCSGNRINNQKVLLIR